MKSFRSFFVLMLLLALGCLLVACGSEEPVDTTTPTSEVTTVTTTTATPPEVTTTVTTTVTTAVTTTTTSAVVTTTPVTSTTPAAPAQTTSPYIEKIPADIAVFTFDGNLAGYTVGYEGDAVNAADTLAAALGTTASAYDATVTKAIRLAIKQDGIIALAAGDYHIYMSGETINIIAGDADGLTAAVQAFLGTVEDGATSHSQYLHTVFLATNPADVSTVNDYINRTELAGTTLENPVTAYQAGDEIVFILMLNTSGNRSGCTKFTYTLKADDCTMVLTGDVNAATGIFAITVPVEMTLIPGSVRLSVNAYDANNSLLPSIYDGKAGEENGVAKDRPKYTYIGGAIVDAEKIASDVVIPEDFETFWVNMLKRHREDDPTLVAPTIAENSSTPNYRNGFAIYKMDAAYLTALGYDEKMVAKLEDFDFYEIYLRCDTDPNGRPAVGYVTVPKNAPAESLPLYVGLNAYGTRDGYLGTAAGAIVLRMHPNGIPKKYYDAATNKFITHEYYALDSGFGKFVKDYDDPYNAYLADMLVRNIQMLHFLTQDEYDEYEPSTTNITDFTDYRKMRDAYNGTIEFLYGGSMGGYQNIGTAALCSLKVGKKQLVNGTVTKIVVGCPWMCDPVAVAGVTDRLPGEGTRIGQTGKDDKPISQLNVVGLSYFDTAHLATLLPEGCSVEIQAGFADTTCPSTGMIALWNAIKEEKKLIFWQNKDHSGSNPNTQIKTIITEPAKTSAE